MFQSNFKAYVKSTITSTQAAGTTFILSTDFEQAANLETGTDSVSFVLKNGTQIERMEITATGGTATIVKRGLTQSQTSTASVGNQKQWTDGSTGFVTALAYDLVNERNAKPLKLTLPTVADNTARTALYPSPTGGEKVMNTSAAGSEQHYNAVTAQWETLGSSTPVVNATTAAAGIVQVATHAKAIAGDNTGSSGATNSVPPSELAATQQSGTFVYAASVDVSDTYTASLTPALTAYTTGQRVRIKFTTANTGACTLNLNSLGAKSIKMRDGNDTPDGAIVALGISELAYDGTNFVLQSAPMAATVTEATTGTDSVKYLPPSSVQVGKIVAGTSVTFTDANSHIGTLTITIGTFFTNVFLAANLTAGDANFAPNSSFSRMTAIGHFQCATSGIRFFGVSATSNVNAPADQYSDNVTLTPTFSTTSSNPVTSAITYSGNYGTVTLSAVYRSGTDLKIDYTVDSSQVTTPRAGVFISAVCVY